MAKQIKGRKFFAATASAALVASAIVPVASAAELKDAGKIPTWAQEAVQALVEGKVIEGDQNGYFNPGGTVTRAVAAQILTKALDLPTTGTENFSDVKEGAWYYDAVVATSNAGIFKGNDLGQFDPNGLLTREQAASVIVRAFGLEGSADLSKFADADKVAGWAKEDMAIAVANGVIKGNGSELNPKASITRAEIAVMVHRTIEGENTDPVETELKVESVSAINNTTVEVTFDEEVTEVDKADFVFDNNLVVSEAKVKEGNKKVVVLTTSAQTAGTTYSLNYQGEPTGKSFVGVTSALTVESVKALNLVEVEVKFNREVSKATAEIISNYEISGIASYNVNSKATLQADGKTVIIELDAADRLQNNKNYRVTVNGVTTADNTVVQRVTKEVTTADTVLPTIEKISTLDGSNAAVLVYFSEPIVSGSEGNYTFTTDVNSIPTPLTASVNAEDRRIVTLTNSGGLPVGNVKINYTGGATDYAGLQALPKFLGEVTTVGQTEVTKLAEVTPVDQNKVRVKFNQAIGTAPNNAFYWNRSGLSGDVGNASDKVTRVDAYTFDVEFNTNALPANEEVSFFAAATVVDTTGNNIAAPVTQSFKVKAAKAEVAKLVSAVAKKNSELVLTFDKAMHTTDLIDNAKYEIYKDGKLVTDSKQGLDSKGHPITKLLPTDRLSNNTQISIKGLNLDSGVYSIKVIDIRDTNNNKVTATVNFTAVNETAPTGKLVQVTDAGNGYDYDHILVHFDQAMDTASLANADNYTIKVGGVNYKLSELAGLVSIVPANGNKTAVITLDKADKAIETATEVTVKNVNSVAGIEMDTFTATGGTLVAVSNAATHTDGVININTHASKVSRVDAKTVSFLLPTHLKTLVADEFRIGKSGGDLYEPSSVTFENITSGDDRNFTKVTIVADREYPLTQALDVSTTTGTKASTDLLGRKFLSASATLTVGQSVADAPKVVNAYVEDSSNGDIVVGFNKNIALLTDADFKLIDPSSSTPTEQKALTNNSSAIPGNTAKLTLSGALTNRSINPTLVLSGLTGTQDDKGQKLAGGVTVEVDNFYATNARLVNKDGQNTGALEAGDSIEITFNSAIDPTTLVPDADFGGVGTTAWNGNTDLKIAATENAVEFTDGGAGNDTITFTGIDLGSFDLGSGDVVGTNVNGMAVTLKLSADKKTVTITFDTVGVIDAAKITGAVFTPNTTTLENAKGSKVNKDASLNPTTVTKF